jgi:hypothetical protein
MACTVLAAVAVGYSGYRTCRDPAADLPGPAADDLTSRDLEVALAVILRSEEAKAKLTDEVIAGRLPLPDAAARFRALEAGRPNRYCRAPLDVVPGNSEGERLCREVITHVHTRLHWEDPAREEEVTARLEAHLRELLAPHGTVYLPE